MAQRGEVATARWELIRALAAVVDTRPEESRAIVRALELPPLDAAEHTATFVLWCPPYAALHLGPEGKLGGAGADRVAGFWRALGLTPPSDPDHLAHLLALYAHLGEAEQRSPAPALGRARATLLTEHLWSWVPGYLRAVENLGGASLAAWAALTRKVLRRELGETPPAPALPLALREAPPPITADLGLDDLLDAVLAPIRSGLILTHPVLAGIARQAGTGYRAGERRFALRAMLEQNPAGTLAGLATEAGRWAGRHEAEAPREERVAAWWAARARGTAAVLARAGRSPAADLGVATGAR